MNTLQDILDKVREQTTAVGSMQALVRGLRDQLRALGGITMADQARIDDIFGAVKENTATVLVAMETNVPAAEHDLGPDDL